MLSVSLDLYATAVVDDDVVTTIRELNFEVGRRRLLDQPFYYIRIDDLG
ncbi:hypothetical protein SAMN05443636_1413 [Halobaculum gomorrense]|uniref:Uncharacterized protein n=1 Tax=Halobaculum gomorrense TaxID=43928 RepID=A0A1M5P0P2_9EURY|nr:hypothetical protein SAMN05443636_1413 [Halobaculum gomorrense]